jgi:hypothetical protein
MTDATPQVESLDETVEALEQRVHRLEVAVAAMSDTQLMEDRVVERVARRVETPPVNANGGFMAGAARFFKGESRNTDAAGDDAVAQPEVIVRESPPKSSWLLFEFIDEIRSAMRMFADYRYRVSWPGRMIPVVCIVLAVIAYFITGLVPIIGTPLNYLIDAVLVVIFYKSMSREVARYQSGAGRILR